MIRFLVALALAWWSATAAAQPALDAGVPVAVDATVLVDAAVTVDDAAPIDAAPRPARRPRDAGVVDAGVDDAGPGDGGLDDAGLDDAGGEDAGIDAMLEPPPPPPITEPSPPAVTGPTDTSSPTSPLIQQPEQPEQRETTRETTFLALKVIIGLIVLAVLAYLGGHRRVVRFQEQLGISGVITAGFPFVALGLIASEPTVGILTDDVIYRMRPLLHFGLGWLGFIIGAQLDIRVLDRVPHGTAYLILVEALGPFAITAASCGAVMVAFGQSWTDPTLWRDVVLLGTAAAMTAPRKFRGFANRTWHEGRGADVLLGQLDELVGVIGLLFITSYFRVAGDSTWQLPDTAWIFVSLGLGVTIGVLIFAMVRVPRSNAEFLAVVLGAIAFASGLAGYLRLSPIVICFLAGALVTNFPNDQRESIFRILKHLERPVQMLFLIIAGALWDVTDWRGWVLVPLFVASRMLGKYAGVLTSRTAVGSLLPAGFADNRQLIAPMSSFSIALVISVGSRHDGPLAWVMTAVIGGSILTEVLVQATSRDTGAPVPPVEPEAHAPIDELDDGPSGRHDGPIYRDDGGGST